MRTEADSKCNTLVYCGLYMITCLTMLSDSLLVLFFGRLTGGVSTTLLFSVFEAWMISTYHEQGLHTSGLELSTVFGNMTTLSCMVAIASGVFGDVLVTYSGTRTWPFMASCLCCVGAAFLISKIWVWKTGRPLNLATAEFDMSVRTRISESDRQSRLRCRT